MANLIIYWMGWTSYCEMYVGIVLGLTVLLITRFCRRSTVKLDSKHAVWVMVYLTGMALFSYLGNYGGGRGILPLYWDILLIAVFSLLILYWSWASRLPAEKAQLNIASIVD
jgi:hypothetical protein